MTRSYDTMSDEKLSERKADVADDENPEWTTADFNRARPASEVFGTDAAAAFVRPRGRPAKAPEARKRQVTLRLSPDVLKAARQRVAGGKRASIPCCAASFWATIRLRRRSASVEGRSARSCGRQLKPPRPE